jgi:hypothetical protein
MDMDKDSEIELDDTAASANVQVLHIQPSAAGQESRLDGVTVTLDETLPGRRIEETLVQARVNLGPRQ